MDGRVPPSPNVFVGAIEGFGGEEGSRTGLGVPSKSDQGWTTSCRPGPWDWVSFLDQGKEHASASKLGER